MQSDVEPFYAIGLSQAAHRMKLGGRSIIHMEFGQPSTGAPRPALDVAHRILDSDGMGYWESAELRARIALLYEERHGLRIDPARVLLTGGASPALVAALAAAFRPGDRVALARPGYVAYRNCIRALHMAPVEIACGPESRYQMSAAAIAAMETPPAGIIVASPANPTGTILAPAEMAAIADVCRERGIRILSDEIYHGLVYDGQATSMIAYAPDAWVINSFSKYWSMAAWRLGWLVAPEAEAERARNYVANLFLTPPSLAQHAALIAMDCEAELESHVETYRRNRELLLEALPRLGLRRIAPPDGAFYIWADIGHLTSDSLSFCMQLLSDTGVATAPGVDFDPVDGNRYMRLSFAVSTAEVEEALRRMEPWFAARRG